MLEVDKVLLSSNIKFITSNIKFITSNSEETIGAKRVRSERKE